jgi:hypothetical protein
MHCFLFVSSLTGIRYTEWSIRNACFSHKNNFVNFQDKTFLITPAAVTVTLACYVDKLNNFLHPELLRSRVNMRQMWFQQDGATAHMARALMEAV